MKILQGSICLENGSQKNKKDIGRSFLSVSMRNNFIIKCNEDVARGIFVWKMEKSKNEKDTQEDLFFLYQCEIIYESRRFKYCRVTRHKEFTFSALLSRV